MPACPVCFGEKHHDYRDMDAVLSEFGIPIEAPLGIVPCDECEATGVVSEPRRRELESSARAAVDQVLAMLKESEHALA